MNDNDKISRETQRNEKIKVGLETFSASTIVAKVIFSYEEALKHSDKMVV